NDGVNNKDRKKDIEDGLENMRENDDYMENMCNGYESGEVKDEGDTGMGKVSYVVGESGLKDCCKHMMEKELKDVSEKENVEI
ncbi:hypothetical protein, partial [Staphylococcus epidermidis]|uniref:hypothetical protein n=1 Tax=Staphylococcus epidermidis TaxID=1282 RepID=UPI0028CB5D44